MLSQVIGVGLALAFVAGLAVACLHLLKLAQARGSANRCLRVEDRIMLNTSNSLVVIAYHDRELLFTVGKDGASLVIPALEK